MRFLLSRKKRRGSWVMLERNIQISLICGCFMMNLCIVMEVIQKSIPARTIVIIPGTHPRTLEKIMESILKMVQTRRCQAKLTRATTSVP